MRFLLKPLTEKSNIHTVTHTHIHSDTWKEDKTPTLNFHTTRKRRGPCMAVAFKGDCRRRSTKKAASRTEIKQREMRKREREQEEKSKKHRVLSEEGRRLPNEPLGTPTKITKSRISIAQNEIEMFLNLNFFSIHRGDLGLLDGICSKLTLHTLMYHR